MNPELRRRIQRYPAFFVGMGVLMALAVAEALALGREYGAWRQGGRELERRQKELVVVSAAANGAAAAEAEALRLERERAMTDIFGYPPEGAAAAGPAGRIEAYADLAAFAERQRRRAAQAGVRVGADERFGFGRFAREGPELASIPKVWRQRIELEPLLEALWVARPRSLTGVWCGEDAAPGPSPRRSLAVSGLVEVSPWRLAFEGDTGCLRRFLPALAGLPGPVVVREVRAEPMPVEGRRPGGPPGTRFMLQLEMLAPTRRPVGSEVGGAASVCAPDWPVPRAQSAGAGWRFEVFEPPVTEYVKDQREWALVVGAPGAAPRQNAELGLVEVRRLPYRWRMVGYGGRPADDEGWVVFEDTRTGRTVRLRRGERDERGAITLAEWRLVRAPGGEQVAEAKVLGCDAEEGWLRAGGQARGTELAAVLRGGGSGALVEAMIGATVRVGTSDYRIDEITEMPASVVLTRLGAPAEAEERLRLEQTAG